VEAVENQPWSGEANVHVSIANWVKTQDAALLPKTRKLWFKVEPSAAAKKLRKRGTNATKEYELDVRECDQINSTLSDETDVSGAKTLACNANPQRVFRGQEPGSRGFVLSHKQKQQIEDKDSKSSEVIFPHLVGRDLLTGDGMPTRWVIDFGDSDQLTAASHSAAFEHVKNTVLVKMEKIAAGEIPREERERFMDQFLRARLGNWWQFRRACVDTISAISKLSRYVVCSRHTKKPVFEFMSSRIRPDSAVQVFAFEDDYSFGILQGFPHTLWFITKCGKLTERLRYSPESVFDTFPWPQFSESSSRRKEALTSSETGGKNDQSLVTSAAMVAKIDAVAAAARELRRVRAEALPKIKGGLRALYRTLELPGANPLKDAHTALDTAVPTAYGFNTKKDLLAQLLALNQKVAAKIETGESVTAPGVPKNYPDAKNLVTEDYIRPSS
jgi:hypothetical protein